MSVSFHGIGQVCATFLGSGTEGQVVKMTDRDTVAPCSDGNSFCGVAMCVKDEPAGNTWWSALTPPPKPLPFCSDREDIRIWLIHMTI